MPEHRAAVPSELAASARRRRSATLALSWRVTVDGELVFRGPPATARAVHRRAVARHGPHRVRLEAPDTYWRTIRP